MKKPKLSFVIPAKNEEKNIVLLYREIVKSIKKITNQYEIIFVDDGSTDNTYKEIKKLKKDKHVKSVKLRGNWGKSVALQIGFNHTKNDIIFTMDADLQDNPKEIERFINKIDEGYDLVTGWKKQRHDPVTKVIPSRILNNFLIPTLTGVRIHDTNCGFKAYKKDVVKNLNLYGELYRYIPIIASKQNFKIAEIEVQHRKRVHGRSKYGWKRNIKGFLDLLTVYFLTDYAKRPAHFFGTAGLISFFFGSIIGLYITYIRITTGGINYHQPLLILGMLLMIIGVQLITTGLIGEMLTSFNQNKNLYENLIEEKIL